MNRTQKVAVVVGVIAILSLTSCGEQARCPDCVRFQQALAEAQRNIAEAQLAIADLQAERDKVQRPAVQVGGGAHKFMEACFIPIRL